MPAKVVRRPQTRQQLVTGTLVQPDPQTASRLLSDLADAHDDLASRQQPRTQTTADLVVGDNLVNHGLGRRARGCTVTPTVADATWAWALTAADDQRVTITTVGVNQPNAAIEVW